MGGARLMFHGSGRRVGVTLGSVFLLLSLLLVLWSIFRPNPLPGAAVRMADSMRLGDGDALFDCTIADERMCSDLTPAKVRRAWEILLKPHLESSRFLRAEPTLLSSNQVQATAGFQYLDKSGNPWRLLMIANQADGGPKTQVIYKMLSLASVFDDKGQAQTSLTADLALKGFRRYRAPLESIGIHGMMLRVGSCYSMDDLERILSKGAKVSK